MKRKSIVRLKYYGGILSVGFMIFIYEWVVVDLGVYFQIVFGLILLALIYPSLDLHCEFCGKNVYQSKHPYVDQFKLNYFILVDSCPYCGAERY